MTVLLSVDRDDVGTACGAIASRRFWSHCECEPEVGWKCGFCRRPETWPIDGFEDAIDYYADWLEAWFRVMAFLETIGKSGAMQ